MVYAANPNCIHVSLVGQHSQDVDPAVHTAVHMNISWTVLQGQSEVKH